MKIDPPIAGGSHDNLYSTPFRIYGPKGDNNAPARGGCANARSSFFGMGDTQDCSRYSTLDRLKLITIRDRLDSLLDEAARRDLNLREALAFLHEEEITHKQQRRIQLSTHMAKFPFIRTLEQYDYEAQASVDPKQIRELAFGRWIANGDTLLLLGPPGVGKTHLAVALGREAIQRNYPVQFLSAVSLVTQLSQAHAQGKLEEKLTRLNKPKLLIIDELGYLPLEPNAGHLFFQLVSRRYGRGSLLITSNRTVGEWGDIFSDALLAIAILDRLLHHSHVLTIRGESYRLKEKRQSGLLSSKVEARGQDKNE